MTRLKRVAFLTGLLLFAIYGFTLVFLAKDSLSAGAMGTLLAQKHQKGGISCAGCHKEAPSNSKVPMITCIQCHGEYTKLAEKTKQLTQNPHASHLEDLECEKCHHIHKPSVDYCAQCHKFDLKVP